MPLFHVAFSSREMLVKRQIPFLLMPEFPEMAFRHPLLEPLYGGLRGRFPWFALETVEHSRHLPAASLAARHARFGHGENGEICYEPMAGFLQEQPVV